MFKKCQHRESLEYYFETGNDYASLSNFQLEHSEKIDLPIDNDEFKAFIILIKKMKEEIPDIDLTNVINKLVELKYVTLSYFSQIPGDNFILENLVPRAILLLIFQRPEEINKYLPFYSDQNFELHYQLIKAKKYETYLEISKINPWKFVPYPITPFGISNIEHLEFIINDYIENNNFKGTGYRLSHSNFTIEVLEYFYSKVKQNKSLEWLFRDFTIKYYDEMNLEMKTYLIDHIRNNFEQFMGIAHRVRSKELLLIFEKEIMEKFDSSKLLNLPPFGTEYISLSITNVWVNFLSERIGGLREDFILVLMSDYHIGSSYAYDFISTLTNEDIDNSVFNELRKDCY